MKFKFTLRDYKGEKLKTGADGYEYILKIEEDIWGKELTRRESKIK